MNEIDGSLFSTYPDMEVLSCCADARVYSSPIFFEDLEDHQNLREIILNTRRDMDFPETLCAGAAIRRIRLPKQIEYADVECAKIDGESFKGCNKLRVLMLPPLACDTIDNGDRNYTRFDTSVWQHWRDSMEVLVTGMACLPYIVPSEIVRATGPPKLALYLEMIPGFDAVECVRLIANLSEIVRSVTICTGKWTFADTARFFEGSDVGTYATEAAMCDAIRAVCPHATVEIVEIRSARRYYLENVEVADPRVVDE
jgi:hypothetical protein